MEEPLLLRAMQRIVRGVQIEDDLPGRPLVRLDEHVDQQPLDRRRIVADPVILRRLRPAQLQPVQRALAGEGRTVRPPRRLIVIQA